MIWQTIWVNHPVSVDFTAYGYTAAIGYRRFNVGKTMPFLPAMTG